MIKKRNIFQFRFSFLSFVSFLNFFSVSSTVQQKDCFIDVIEKNGNLWVFTIDFGSGYVYMLEPKEDKGSFDTDNEAFNVIILMLQGKNLWKTYECIR